MREPDVIAAYAASVAERLDFDPSLSQRVRHEVEDHLWQSMGESGSTTAQEATSRFGSPQVLAAEFATVWLAQQTRKLSAAAVLLVLALFLMMKARLAWYGIVQWTMNEQVRTVGSTVGTIDVYAFWLAAAFLVIGWAYLAGYRAAASCAAQCRRFRHVVYLTSLSLLGLMVSVTCDAVLMVLRLVGRDFSVAALIPIGSVAAETALVGALILKLTRLAAGMSRTTALAEPDALLR